MRAGESSQLDDGPPRRSADAPGAHDEREGGLRDR